MTGAVIPSTYWWLTRLSSLAPPPQTRHQTSQAALKKVKFSLHPLATYDAMRGFWKDAKLTGRLPCTVSVSLPTDHKWTGTDTALSDVQQRCAGPHV